MNARFRSLWWVNPAGYLLLLLLPLFVVSAWLGAPLLSEFGMSNFLTPETIWIGGGSIATLALGCMAGGGTRRTERGAGPGLSFDPQRYDLVLILLIVISVCAHLLLLAPILAKPSLVFSVVSGERGANFEAKDAAFRLVGVTSLTNLSMLCLTMSSIRFVSRGAFSPSRLWTLALAALSVLILAHAFLASERLKIVENAVAFSLPLFSYWPRLRLLGGVSPVLGFGAILSIFALGEYQRSWAYYQSQYNSFWEFVVLRLMAYISGASNTGAGIVSRLDPIGRPTMTGRWMVVATGEEHEPTAVFLQKYGNLEYNNPSGIFAAVGDYGTMGFVYLFLFGLMIGFLYRMYSSKEPIGLIAYPLVFIGFTDLTQVWYWGEPRFIPQIIALVVVLAYVLRKPSLRRPALG